MHFNHQASITSHQRLMFFLVVVFFFLVSCNHQNRDHLHFGKSSAVIRQTIEETNILIAKLNCKGTKGYYFHDHGYLYIDNKMLPNDEQDLFNHRAFKWMSGEEKRTFIHHIQFLNDHHLYGCHFDPNYEAYIYNYIRFKEVNANLYRAVLLAEQVNDDVLVMYDLLDQKDGLALIKRK